MMSLSSLLALSVLLSVPQQCAAEAPHIVFMLFDDIGWNDVSMHGSPDIPTPNIDGLASEGIRLNSYYVNPVCSPTRASLMTGRSIIHHGIFTPYGQNGDHEGLNLTYTLLPQHLKASYGYRTYMVGKWHLGRKTADYLPSHRGYDKYFGYYSGVMDYWTHGMSGPSPNSGGLDLHEGGKDFALDGAWPRGTLDRPVYNTTGEYSTYMFARQASAWIEKHAQETVAQPMFMYIAFQGCHSGDNSYVQAPLAGINRFEALSPDETCSDWQKPGTGSCTKVAMRKSVAACVSAVDDAVGDVTIALQRASMYDNTLIVMSTDNGGPTDNTDNNNMNNFPLRGCKGGYFDGGMRAVGVMHGAGLHRTGWVSDTLHHVNDWLPTLLTAAKQGALDDPTAAHIVEVADGERPFMPGDGIDNWAALSSGASSARTEIIHVVQAKGSVLDSHALRQGDMKLLWHPAGTDCSKSHAGWYPPPNRAVNYANFTIKCPPPPSTIGDCTAEAPCLFNITSDPCEHVNLAQKHPGLVAAMTKRIDEYREHTVLSWMNFEHNDPAGNPENLGPETDGYHGVYDPWLALEDDSIYYPTNYTGPGYPTGRDHRLALMV